VLGGLKRLLNLVNQTKAIMETTLKQALQVFYDDNNFGEDGGIKEDWVWLKFKFFSIPIPNLEQRKINVWKHDILHILLGYDNSWKGETSVAGWTLGSGGWGNIIIAWFLDFFAFGIGLVCFPKSTYEAFIRGRKSLSPHLLGIEKEKLLSSSIVSLRERFKFNKTPIQSNLTDKALFLAWAGLVLGILIIPILIFLRLFI
jgi:hypothetical protein